MTAGKNAKLLTSDNGINCIKLEKKACCDKSCRVFLEKKRIWGFFYTWTVIRNWWKKVLFSFMAGEIGSVLRNILWIRPATVQGHLFLPPRQANWVKENNLKNPYLWDPRQLFEVF